MVKPIHSVRVVSWNEERAAEISHQLTMAGFAAEAGMVDAATIRQLGKEVCAAFVIDLGRLPAQGRDLGIMLRTRASSRRIPLVFVDGADEKVARTRQVLPDATFTTRREMSSALTRVIADPPAEPVVPSSNFAGYSGTPLPKKLGIKRDSLVALVDAPDGFETILGNLPPGATMQKKGAKDASVTLWFVRSLADLADGIERMADLAADGRLWVCWPKKASGIVTDLTQNNVRSRGLAAGIVDFKICAIDPTWSGLCFTRRKI